MVIIHILDLREKITTTYRLEAVVRDSQIADSKSILIIVDRN